MTEQYTEDQEQQWEVSSIIVGKQCTQLYQALDKSKWANNKKQLLQLIKRELVSMNVGRKGRIVDK